MNADFDRRLRSGNITLRFTWFDLVKGSVLGLVAGFVPSLLGLQGSAAFALCGLAYAGLNHMFTKLSLRACGYRIKDQVNMGAMLTLMTEKIDDNDT